MSAHRVGGCYVPGPQAGFSRVVSLLVSHRSRPVEARPNNLFSLVTKEL